MEVDNFETKDMELMLISLFPFLSDWIDLSFGFFNRKDNILQFLKCLLK